MRCATILDVHRSAGYPAATAPSKRICLNCCFCGSLRLGGQPEPIFRTREQRSSLCALRILRQLVTELIETSTICGKVDRVRLLLVLACVGDREAERRSERIQDTATTLGGGKNIWLVDELSTVMSQLRMLDGNKRGGRQNGNDTYHDTKTRLNYRTLSNKFHDSV